MHQGNDAAQTNLNYVFSRPNSIFLSTYDFAAPFERINVLFLFVYINWKLEVKFCLRNVLLVLLVVEYRGHSEPNQTYKMELFCGYSERLKSLNVFAKCCIVDV